MKLFMPAAPRQYSIDSFNSTIEIGESAVWIVSLSICVLEEVWSKVAMFLESHAFSHIEA